MNYQNYTEVYFLDIPYKKNQTQGRKQQAFEEKENYAKIFKKIEKRKKKKEEKKKGEKYTIFF